MGMTGIEIFKLLPKTNCGDCGVATCLAFAMNLAGGKAELDQCPHVTEDAKKKLVASSAPPIRPITIGDGEYQIKIGGELVLFRHEKTFFNPTGLACLVTTDEESSSIEGKIERFKALRYDRVGLILKPELFAVKDTSGDAVKFESLIKKIMDSCDASLILISDNPEVMEAGLKICKDKKPLIYCADITKGGGFAKLAGQTKCPICIKGQGDYDSIIKIAGNLHKGKISDLVIDSGTRNVKKALEEQVAIRRAALGGFRPLGFPTIVFPCEMTDDPKLEMLYAAMFIAKYAGIVVLSDFQPEAIFPLLLERLNIFTDPQRPMTADEKIYPINNPDENSPVLLTSNFSLTYFIVSGEIEASRVPAWLLVKDTEGLSVLTAWAAGKFSAETIAPFINKCGIAEKIGHKNLVIPGYAASISGELEEELPDWKIRIGPREAAHLAKYLKEWNVE